MTQTQLSDEEQRALIVLMDSVMKRSQVDCILGKRTTTRSAAKSKTGLPA
jgi:hypothetical protein